MKSNNQDPSKLKISFQLKNEKSPYKPVIAFINYGHKEIDLLTRKVKYKPLIISTGLKLLAEDWDSELKMPAKVDDRNIIWEIRRNIVIAYGKLSKKGEVDFEEFKSELEERIHGKEKPELNVNVRLVDFIQNHILISERISKGTKKLYNNLSNKIEEFEKNKGFAVTSKNINEKLFLEFMDTVRAKLSRINSVWSIQKVFKATLHEISRLYKIEVFNPGEDLSNRDKVQSENADAVYLNMDQIQEIIDYEPEEDRLYNAKFIFLTLLFTGCRESDVYKIYPESKHSAKGITFNYVRYIAQKTETEILCPILKPLQDMYDENDGKPPRKISQQNLNLYIKEIVKKCGLDNEVTTTYTDSKGKKQMMKKKLHQFVTSHTGRRSFITNLINFIPLPTLTKITGHKLQDKSIIFAYNKMNLIENAVMFCKLIKQVTEENPEYFPFELL